MLELASRAMFSDVLLMGWKPKQHGLGTLRHFVPGPMNVRPNCSLFSSADGGLQVGIASGLRGEPIALVAKAAQPGYYFTGTVERIRKEFGVPQELGLRFNLPPRDGVVERLNAHLESSGSEPIVTNPDGTVPLTFGLKRRTGAMSGREGWSRERALKDLANRWPALPPHHAVTLDREPFVHAARLTYEIATPPQVQNYMGLVQIGNRFSAQMTFGAHSAPMSNLLMEEALILSNTQVPDLPAGFRGLALGYYHTYFHNGQTLLKELAIAEQMALQQQADDSGSNIQFPTAVHHFSGSAALALQAEVIAEAEFRAQLQAIADSASVTATDRFGAENRSRQFASQYDHLGEQFVQTSPMWAATSFLRAAIHAINGGEGTHGRPELIVAEDALASAQESFHRANFPFGIELVDHFADSLDMTIPGA